MPDSPPVVIVVDDDASIRDSLCSLMESVGLGSRAYPDAKAFLAEGQPDCPACLVLDVRLPGQSGLELQQHLNSSGSHLPIIFITGHADVPMTVRAMKSGAAEFMLKPFREQDILEAVHQCIERSRADREKAALEESLARRYAQLTPREKQVLALVASGRLNKQIAGEIGLAEFTVKVHRAQVMRKMAARSLAELVRMADRLKLSPAQGAPLKLAG